MPEMTYRGWHLRVYADRDEGVRVAVYDRHHGHHMTYGMSIATDDAEAVVALLGEAMTYVDDHPAGRIHKRKGETEPWEIIEEHGPANGPPRRRQPNPNPPRGDKPRKPLGPKPLPM